MITAFCDALMLGIAIIVDTIGMFFIFGHRAEKTEDDA